MSPTGTTLLVAVLAALAATAVVLLLTCGILLRRVRRVERELDAFRRGDELRALVRRRQLEALAHELRTPLTAIMGYQELLAEGIYGSLDGRGDEAIVRIGRAAQQLMHLLEGMVEIGRDDNAHVELHPTDVDPNPLLSSVREHAEALAADYGAQLESSIPVDLPFIVTDPERVSRMLHLMVASAVRYSPGSSLRLEARSADGSLEVSVAGTAIPEDALVASSEPGPDVERRRLPIRLLLAQRMAHLLQGELEVRPDGAGTAVHVRIPPLARSLD